MTHDQLDQDLAAANPLPADRARTLAVHAAQAELLAGILATPQPAHASRGRQLPPARAVRLRRRVISRGLAGLVATAAALVALLSLTAGPGHHGPGVAWGAEQVRFAERSPLLLLGAAGWRVEYANESSAQEGELHFRIGAPPKDAAFGTPDLHYAQLNWRNGDLDTWVEDRAHDAAASTTTRVLGTTAHVYQYRAGTPGDRDITALFGYDGRVVEFRAGAADIPAFTRLLATLTSVDTNTWLSAMPASVVKPTERDRVITQMLSGVTVPPGFSASDIKGTDLTSDRYQVAVSVVGTVTCQWFKRWSDARAAHDGSAERDAVAAMGTAKHWPILKDMAKDGGYPQVVLGFAAAMPQGVGRGGPLEADVNTGLGCDSLGVKLPKLAPGMAG